MVREEEQAGIPVPDVIEATLDAEAESPSRWGKIKHAARVALAFSGIGLGCGLIASHYIPTETPIGANRGETTLSFDGDGTLDLGAIGSLVKDLSGTLGLGAHVAVKEISSCSGSNAATDTLSTNDLEQCVASFSNVSDDLAAIPFELGLHVAELSAAIGVSAFASYYSFRKTFSYELNPAIPEFFEGFSHRKPVRVAVATFVAATSFGWPAISNAQEQGEPVDSSFNGTQFEGLRIVGEPLQVLFNKYGKKALELRDENNTYYDQKVYPNIEAAFKAGHPLLPTKTTDTIGFLTDSHGNASMLKVTAKSFHDLFKVNFVTLGGDTTASGTKFEKYVIDAFAKALQGTPAKAVIGNHDDRKDTKKQFEDKGITVMDGKIHEEQGYTMLGDSDPRRSIFGQEIYQQTTETVAQLGTRLVNTIDPNTKNNPYVDCDPKKAIDILDVHDVDTGTEALIRKCVRLVLSGHLHTETIKYYTQNGVVAVSLNGASDGAADTDQPSYGPMKNGTTSTFYVISEDKATHLPTAIQRVTVRSDASVQLDDPIVISLNAPQTATN